MSIDLELLLLYGSESQRVRTRASSLLERIRAAVFSYLVFYSTFLVMVCCWSGRTVQSLSLVSSRGRASSRVTKKARGDHLLKTAADIGLQAPCGIDCFKNYNNRC